MTDGTARPIAPFVNITLEDIIRRATVRLRTNGEKNEKTEESCTETELPPDILFLRIGGRESVMEIVNRAQRRRRAGGDNVTVMAANH